MGFTRMHLKKETRWGEGEGSWGEKQGRHSYLTGVFAVPSLGVTLGPAALCCTSGQEAGLGKAGVCMFTG